MGTPAPAPPAAAAEMANQTSVAAAVAARRIFESVDTDGDGSISSAEFAAWCSRRQLATADELGGALDEAAKARILQFAAQFEAFDTDKSGALDPDEFGRVLEAVAVGGWREAWDAARQRIYYYHVETEETRWEVPGEDEQVAGFLQSVGIELP